MSSWQDIVLAICVLFFNIALIPSVLGKDKPQLSTSLLTFLFLLPQVVVFISLSLWYAFAMSFINACLWASLAFQKIKANRATGSIKSA
ncbi:MAG: hypothetical protein ABI716_03150 [Candidatus Saccharibacteria bacterium]